MTKQTWLLCSDPQTRMLSPLSVQDQQVAKSQTNKWFSFKLSTVQQISASCLFLCTKFIKILITHPYGFSHVSLLTCSFKEPALSTLFLSLSLSHTHTLINTPTGQNYESLTCTPFIPKQKHPVTYAWNCTTNSAQFSTSTTKQFSSHPIFSNNHAINSPLKNLSNSKHSNWHTATVSWNLSANFINRHMTESYKWH